ncbi:hypothetical protein Tco_0314576, partial [Tanacetum coccineum]
MAATVAAAHCETYGFNSGSSLLCHVWVQVWYASWCQVFTRPGYEPTSNICSSSSRSVTFQISEQMTCCGSSHASWLRPCYSSRLP